MNFHKTILSQEHLLWFTNKQWKKWYKSLNFMCSCINYKLKFESGTSQIISIFIKPSLKKGNLL